MSDNHDAISQKINVHSPVNPPHAGFGLDIKLNLTNQNHMAITNWDASEVPNFILEIKNPVSIELDNFQEHVVDMFMEHVVLACNLVLTKAAFSRHSSDQSHVTINRKKELPIPPKIENTETGKKITFNETVRITDSVSITMGFEDELDENKIIDNLNKIQTVFADDINSHLKIQDLQKSLREYYSGTTSFEKLGIFKHLYSSLELSTNCDGLDRTGVDLDNEINKISNIDLSKIQDFRNFNSRTKHIDKNSQDELKYKEGMSKLGEKITPLRISAQKVILHRLNQL